MDAAEHQRRAEPAAVRRRHVERHCVGGQRLQAPPQPFQLGIADAGAGAALARYGARHGSGIDRLSGPGIL
jgi:hypothetical protein